MDFVSIGWIRMTQSHTLRLLNNPCLTFMLGTSNFLLLHPAGVAGTDISETHPRPSLCPETAGGLLLTGNHFTWKWNLAARAKINQPLVWSKCQSQGGVKEVGFLIAQVLSVLGSSVRAELCTQMWAPTSSNLELLTACLKTEEEE